MTGKGEIDVATGWPADEYRRVFGPSYWGDERDEVMTQEELCAIPSFREDRRVVDPVTGWPLSLLASRKLREIERDLVAARAPPTKLFEDIFAEVSQKTIPRQIALARQNSK